MLRARVVVRGLALAARAAVAMPPVVARQLTFAVAPRTVAPIASSSRLFHSSRLLQGDADVTIPFKTSAESIVEGQIMAFDKAVGDGIGPDDTVISVETDKEVAKISAGVSGVVAKFLVEKGATVKVGQPLFVVTPGAAPAPAAAAPASAAAAPAAAPAPKQAEAPKAAKPAAPAPAPVPTPAAAAPAPSAPAPPAGSRGETRVKMSLIRARTAERLKSSQNTAAMLTTFNEVDMSNLISFRNAYKDDIQKKKNVKLGFMSAFCKAAVYALKDQPVVNAYIDGKEIVYHDYIDISVAVSSPRGLVVPVVRNAESMTFLDIERKLAELSAKARDSTLTLEEMTGGTFTISNGGVFGSLMGTPILNPPQAAILGMHAVNDRPVAINGQVVIRPMMYLALTYDHRLIDGREAVTFLRKIKEAVEDPRVLLL